MICLWVVLFVFILLDIEELLKSVNVCLSSNWEKFCPLIFRYIFPPILGVNSHGYLNLYFKGLAWLNGNHKFCLSVVNSGWNMPLVPLALSGMPLCTILVFGSARNLARVYTQNFVLLSHGFLSCTSFSL